MPAKWRGWRPRVRPSNPLVRNAHNHALTMAGTKRCKRCQLELSVEQFHRTREGQIFSRCRSCHGVEVRKCVVCGGAFEAKANVKLCSDRCRKIYRPQTFVICRHCGCGFGPVDHLRRQYCSCTCAYAARATGRRPSRQCTREAKSAQRRVHYMIESGRWTRPEHCSQCGRTGLIEAAHQDYSDPLRVRWLCRSCHARWDKQEPKGGCPRTTQERRIQ